MNVGEVIVGDDAKAVGRAAAKEPLSVYQRVWPIFGCGVSAASVVADREATEAERARLTTRCNRCNISTSVHGRRSWNRRASAESLETQVKVRGRCGSCLSGALESVRDRGSSLFRGACGDDCARWRSVSNVIARCVRRVGHLRCWITVTMLFHALRARPVVVALRIVWL